MKVRKAVLTARIEKALAKLDDEKKQHEATFTEYRAQYLAYLTELKTQLETATNYETYSAMPTVRRPEKPQLRYQWDEHRKRLKRNLAIIEAFDGDTIEVQALKTGKQYSLGEILDTIFDVDD